MKVISILFFGLLGVLLLNSGLGLGIGEHIADLCRIVAGVCAIILAVMEF